MLVVLMGYRGTGKTTVGKLLAQRLQSPFVDTDQRVQKQAGKTIAEIFADEGESGFRDWETAVIQNLARRFRGVLALGGGAILRDENVAALKPPGIFVWLQAPPETIAARLADDPQTSAQRPPLTPSQGIDEIKQVLTQRWDRYQACADVTIDTAGKEPAQIVDEIVAALPQEDSEHELSK